MKQLTQREKIRILVKAFDKVSITMQEDGGYKAMPQGALFVNEEPDRFKWLEASATGGTVQKSLVNLFDFLSTKQGTDGKSIEVSTLGEGSSRGGVFRWDEEQRSFILVGRMC